MRLVFDCTKETLYPLAQPGFSGGSQVYVKQIIKGMVAQGHDVHVIANDLIVDEQRGPHEYWWPSSYHPREFDIAIQQMHCNPEPQYNAPKLILMTSCVDPDLGPDGQWAKAVDAIPVFSQVHKDLLLKIRPTVDESKVFITGLGVDLEDYLRHPNPSSIAVEPVKLTEYKIPGRMLYANDPARGLFYTLDVFDLVKQQVPHATLHVAYDFERQFEMRKWEHSHMAQMLWECKDRLENTPGVVNLGALSREEIIREQLECQIHCYPADPPGIGTQTHGLTQLECAAAGCVLVLSDIEAFPEVFGAGAVILPVIGKYMPSIQERITARHYANMVVELMNDEVKWREMSIKARKLAETMTWDQVVSRWIEMISKLQFLGVTEVVHA